MNKQSPKGQFRMWQAVPFFMAGVFGLYLLGTDWGNANIPVWFMPLIKFLSASSIGIVTVYYLARLVIHHRTHELTPEEQIVRGHYQWLGLAVLVGLVLSAAF